MEDGRINDSQITTSGIRVNSTAYGWHARLRQNNKQWSAWCVNVSRGSETKRSYDQYIEIDLLTLTKITGIATQGREVVEGCEWAEFYKISYRRDNGAWVFYQEKDRQVKERFCTDKIHMGTRQLSQLSECRNQRVDTIKRDR